MDLLLTVLCIVGIVALIYLITLFISIRRLALTAEERLKVVTDRLDTTLDGVDALTAISTGLVSELSEKLPNTLERTDAMIDRIENDLIPTLHNANEATEQLSQVAHLIGDRVTSIDKIFSWVQVAKVFKATTTKPNNKWGILSSVVSAAVQMGLPWLRNKQKSPNE